MKVWCSLVLLVLISCTTSNESTAQNTTDVKDLKEKETSAVVITPKDSVVDKKSAPMLILGKDTLVSVNYFNADVQFELKYATSDNFMKQVLYDTIDVAWLQISVARRLAKAQSLLGQLKPGYHLLVYDALRPVSVQWQMWNALDTIPVSERIHFVSNPRNGSIHNYGAAVDLTIVNEQGKPLDMGAGYDDIRKIAYPSMETYFLEKGELTSAQIANRNLLRKTMKAGNFMQLSTEWWHFNACSRETAKQKFRIITKEIQTP